MTPERRGTLPFFLLTFAITWGLQVPGVLAQQGVLPGNPSAYLPAAALGIFGPLAAATILTRREGGRAAVRELFGRLLLFRAHPGYYLLALLPAALLSALLFLMNEAGRSGPIAFVPPLGGLVLGIVISIAEEVGWRGYALPRLARRFGAFGASTLLGMVWCVWHIPMFLGQGIPMNLLLGMLLLLWGGSLLMTFIAERTGGSLVLAVVAHFAAHLNNPNRALPGETLPLAVAAVVYGALGLALMRSSLPGARGKGRVSTAPRRDRIGDGAWKRPDRPTVPASLMS